MLKHTASSIAVFIFTVSAAAASNCGWGSSEYQLEWADGITRGNTLLRDATMAVASSAHRDGEPSYENITLEFSGLTHRFMLDSPRALETTAQYDGHLELRQQLAYHDEFTVLEILFPRPVENLSFKVSDFDEDRTFSGGFADRLRIEGKEPVDHWTVLPVVSPTHLTGTQNKARRNNLYKYGLAEEIEMRPIKIPAAGSPQYSDLTVSFKSPVTEVRIEFSSDPGEFSNEQFTMTPDAQRVVLSNLTYCADAGR